MAGSGNAQIDIWNDTNGKILTSLYGHENAVILRRLTKI